LDISIVAPLMHRYDEGMWVFQNAPLTDGFIVLLPTLGYPPTPVQHVVAVHGTPQHPKGSIFRLDNQDLLLWRRVDALPFNVSAGDSGTTCTCS
jgi:hypothetical protein